MKKIHWDATIFFLPIVLTDIHMPVEYSSGAERPKCSGQTRSIMVSHAVNLLTLNLVGSKIGTGFQKAVIGTAADALTTHEAVLLTAWDKEATFVYKEVFQLLMSHLCEGIKKKKICIFTFNSELQRLTHKRLKSLA